MTFNFATRGKGGLSQVKLQKNKRDKET